jgi:hypothetical protein
VKRLLTLLFIILSTTCFCQFRKGYSESKVRAEFNFLSFTTEYAENNTKYITADMDYGTFIMFFFKYDECIKTVISTKDKKYLHGKIQYLNNNCTIISKTEWNDYLEHSIVTINLEIINGYYCIIFQ